ncbi:MAG: CAP domain-containing protein, partial [bacterium]|nr:CAP domain-containing protein [bacterium]
GYFSHVGPEGAEPWYWIKKAGYDYVYAGENLARGFIDANSVFNAWMKSAGHRANILNSRYTEIGVAVLSGNMAGRETTLIVQMFGSRPKAGAAPLKTDSGQPFLPEINKLTMSIVSDISGINQNIFAAGLFFVFLIFLLNIFIHRQVQYRDLIFNGLILIVVILGVMILNHRLIGLNLEILNGISI